ncbi:uncharacterized protein [Antedon mediterranea]|uniref:uncharacterized protein n=1 Tax=Antedon mediterranea TaxID=105859 RepID=UPI003AF4B9DF
MKLHKWIILLIFGVVNSSFPPAIRDLKCVSTNVEDYSCSWTIGPNDNITYYTVTFDDRYQSEIEVCPAKKKLVQNGQKLTCRFHKDTHGSVLSQEIKVCGTKSQTTSSVKFYPREDARANPPTNIQFPSNTSTTIEVIWKKPQDVNSYAHMLMYQLEYRKHNQPSSLLETDENSITLTALDEYTVYEIRLASRIERTEWGSWSPVHQVATLPGVPGIVSNMSAMFIPESNTLALEWRTPSETNGPIDYYEVRNRYRRQEWSTKTTTGTAIDIFVDCTNRTDGGILTTTVAAVNKVGDIILKGEWAQRDFPVCGIDYVTMLPTPIANGNNVVIITLTVIIVISLVVLLLILAWCLIKRNSKLDLSGSPNINRRYKFEECPPTALEEEKFDELNVYNTSLDKLSFSENASNSTDDDDLYTRIGVACHAKLAVTYSKIAGPNSINDTQHSPSPAQEEGIEQNAKPLPPLPNEGYVLGPDPRCLPQNVTNEEVYTPLDFKIGYNTKGKGNNNEIATDSYLPHNAIGHLVPPPPPPEEEGSDQRKSDQQPKNGTAYVPHNMNIILNV